MNYFNFSLTRLIALMIILPSLTSCAHVNVTQLAYEVLRQEDCRRNKLEDFCSRNFAKEYFEYERLRQEYIRSSSQTRWRPETGELSNMIALN